MATVADALDGLSTAVTFLSLVNTKMDQIIVKIQNLSQGGGATQQELDQIVALIGDVQSGLVAVDTKADQALTI